EVTDDEHPRPETTLEGLAKLQPAFRKDGTITAGNASGITDGAAALVLMAEDEAEARGLKLLARVRSYAVAAVEPQDFPVAPVPAMRRAVEKAGLTFDDMDVVEINEAFAAQMLVCMAQTGLDRNRVNIYGGAIALGHPIGMSGVRIVLTLAKALAERGGRYGLAGICGNGGHGGAMVIENLGAH
ncbi:MAG: thiolase family protein, partial [Chloroflexota bacterium]|nr:thiolase family protein [Chloroflexota bacterium]